MNRRIVGSILVIIFLGILFLIIGCGLFDNNSQPKIEPITDQTLDVGDETTVTPNITDVDVDDTHSVNAFSDNMNVAAVSVNDTSITITGKAAGVTTITVTAIDDSDQDNDTSIPVTFQVIVNEPPLEESYYDHIEGPWLWMIAPGGDIDDDNLSETSDGVITERQIALKGVNEGNHFDTLQWSSGRLLPTTVCGIFLCSSDNVINVVREIGLSNTYLAQYSAYALINIYSPSDQNDVLMGIGSDDSIKVWLNGTVVYKNDFNRRTTGIQNRFNVDLNRGNNLLLVKVCNHFGDWGMFFKIYLDPEAYTISLPVGDNNSWQPVRPEEPEQPNESFSITISEIMYGSEAWFSPPQWIELSNTGADPVNMAGWKLTIQNVASEDLTGPVNGTIVFRDEFWGEAPIIWQNETLLIVTDENETNSGGFLEDQIFDLRGRGGLEIGLWDTFLSAEGFRITLTDKDGNLVDAAGKYDGGKTVWNLPYGINRGRTRSGNRTSLLRLYANGVGLDGTKKDSWISAADANLAEDQKTYYGDKNDISSPGILGTEIGE